MNEAPTGPARGILQKFQLHGKKALVTGSATGLGAAIAIALAEAGAAVACHGNRRAAQDTVNTITAAGGSAVAFSVDLAHTASAEVLINHTIEALGQVDILVNNAGMIVRHDAAEHPLEDWMSVLQVNLTSVFQLSQLAAQGMLERGEGKIINIASLLSFQGGIRVSAYAASKGGIAQLTKALANEWASRNVQVNAIAPGYIRTGNTSALQADETRSRQILERIPTGRWGEPEDLAAAAVFLASAASNYVTGAILNVDGGWLAR